jgi:hypothetical protein
MPGSKNLPSLTFLTLFHPKRTGLAVDISAQPLWPHRRIDQQMMKYFQMQNEIRTPIEAGLPTRDKFAFRLRRMFFKASWHDPSCRVKKPLRIIRGAKP